MALTSVWEDARPRDPAQATVAGHYEVVVVGGGLTGVTTALLLASAGRSVLVVEARHLGAGTTGSSTAKVSVLQGTRLSQIARRHPPETVRHYARANLEALAWLRGFCDEHGVAWQQRAACTYATTDRGARAVEQEHRVALRAGLPTTHHRRPDFPFPTTAAVSLPDQAQLDPVELLHALASRATSSGATLVEGVRVRGVRGSSPARVVTEAGTVSADTVVLATNMPVLDRGGYFARLKPTRSYVLAFQDAEPFELDGMYLSADAPTRSVRDAVVAGERYLLVGGEGHTTGRGHPTTPRLDALRVWTAEHFPTFRETHSWSAQDYLPAHQLPLAGPLLPESDHLLVAGGYAKWGMTNAVAASLALTARLLGGRTEWADALAAWTRSELAGLDKVASFNAEVSVELALGWVRSLAGTGRSPDEGQGIVRVGGTGSPAAHSRVDGVERVVSAVCSHLGGIVRWNDAEQSWDCPLHGSRFAPDGSVLEGPATCGLRPRRLPEEGGARPGV